MSLIKPVHLAACERLAKYLTSVLPDVEVESRWPDPDKSLPDKAITIIPAGVRNPVFMEAPQLVSSEDIGDPPNKLFKWRIAELEQPMQLDVWSRFPLDRDDIVARLDKFLNVGFSQLSNATISTLTVDQNIALELEDEWADSIAYYVFDTVDYDDTPDQVTRQEYRATYHGTGFFNLTQSAIKPSIAVVKMKVKLMGESSYTEFDT